MHIRRRREQQKAPHAFWPMESGVLGLRHSPLVDSWWSLEEQVERAAKLQQSLLPDLSAPLGEYRFATLYRPCEALGGDFYDLYQNCERAALLVSDVMGHGVEAALTTTMIKAVFQETAAKTLEPCELLTRMDARLQPLLARRTFVAAGVATLELDGSAVHYAQAGLPHPFVLRSRSRRVEELRLNGCPLGLLEIDRPRTYERATLTLEDGDVLLMASDGLGSIVDGTDETFEDGRLMETLERAAGQDGKVVVKQLMAEAHEFSHGKPQPDDINLIAITRGQDPNRGSTTDPYGSERGNSAMKTH